MKYHTKKLKIYSLDTRFAGLRMINRIRNESKGYKCISQMDNRLTDKRWNLNIEQKYFRSLLTFSNEGGRDDQFPGGEGETHPECEEECQTPDGGERHQEGWQ